MLSVVGPTEESSNVESALTPEVELATLDRVAEEEEDDAVGGG
jgi:hypothetical protein